ncbi:MAG: bifunctional riboflavin kinase/FAD synthetase [Lachnospiraceae bacterium]|nr:bifunctional riboflavin kinase/FAD synthetase [Lachnospiraceae bacterium]
MIYISGTKDFKLNNTAVALGKFDGLHRGHKVLIDRINKLKEKGMLSVMFTFDYHPNSLFGDKEQQLIYTMKERRVIAEKMGIDILIEYPFTEETAAMEPADFIKEVLIDKVGARFVVVGEDFRFGSHRAGNTDLLEGMSLPLGYSAVICRKVCDMIPMGFDDNLQPESREISATLIRKAISKGDVELANRLLGYPFNIIGEVVHGREIGRTIGMPTANIIAPGTKLLPPNGVYYSKTKIFGKLYNSVTNIGYNPTVSDKNSKRIETYVYDFKGDLYGKSIEVELYHYGRPEMKFASLDALKTQMHKDGERSKRYFAQLASNQEK